MQIIIPMSGSGQRFLDAGYNMPKSLISVRGKPVIAHVIDMFDAEEDEFIFICSNTHLEETNMRATLGRHCPNGRIIGIDPHKLGPVHAVRMAYEYIRNEEPAIVNYCDFTCYWDYRHFKEWLQRVQPEGCIPAYRGFHPHSLGSTNYAFIKESKGRVEQIQEKQPFTENKMAEFASSGTYYFSQGRTLKYYLDKAVENDLSVNGEYYCSLPFNLMINDALTVKVYELQHFMQWGTPADLEEFINWSDIFEKMCKKDSGVVERLAPGSTLVPLAGKGSRFKSAGYKKIKPLLNVSGKEMVVQATHSLPKTKKYQFAVLEETALSSDVLQRLRREFPNSGFTTIKEVLPGQACSCLEAIECIDKSQYLTISACDHSVMYDSDALDALLKEQDPDIIIWTKSGHAGAIRNPEMYGWVDTDGVNVTRVSVKSPLSSPGTDQLLIGTFTFKSAGIFAESTNSMISRGGAINDEYYIDNAINDALASGLRCVIFEVDHYICWGTPDELKTFEYWQSCFHKWTSHPYSWDKDIWRYYESEMPHHLSKLLPDVDGYLKEVA